MRRLLKPTPVLALIAALPLALFMPRALPAETPVVDHAMEIALDPAAGTLQVTDRLTLPAGRDSVDLVLHKGLAPRVLEGGATLEPLAQDEHLEALRLHLRPGEPGVVTLGYGGTIRHDLTTAREGMGRARQDSPGTIGPDGVFLDGASGWYPRVPGTLQRFDLRVTLPDGWHAVSQGEGPERAGFAGSAWREQQPQDDIYLIAAPFTLYRGPAGVGGGAEAQVWLRTPDESLAARYLAATREYLDLYARLIGPYPYAKFALVENFWESGYGMPSFTLLGPQVIRLPFILTSSYPHEVLHNWWGNGVYVEARTGNWSEGLTNYLADHLMKEREGQGAAYRRDGLQAYADYVSTDADFPLSQFRGRHGEASQTVGYGKAAMVFHNLRVQLGDGPFLAGLRRFYVEHRFRAAGWADLRRAFESTGASTGSSAGETKAESIGKSAGGLDLKDYFTAWTTRPGALRLSLTEAEVEPMGTGYRVSGRIMQTQNADPFPVMIPVVVHQTAGAPQRVLVPMRGREARFSLELPSAPVRLAVDPEFDSFRALEPGEASVTLGALFGAERGLILLPAGAAPEQLAAWRDLAGAWTAGHPGWQTALDSDRKSLPADRPVWLLGWENRFLPSFAAGSRDFSLGSTERTLSIAGTPVGTNGASLVLSREQNGYALGWLGTTETAAIPGLARKVPHYGKYGYLAFAGPEPTNRLKGQWPPGDSALVRWFGEARPELAPVARPSLDQAAR